MPKQRPSSRARTASPRRPGGAGTLRLIGGDYRGRRLPIADIEGLRPTGDRQRETLFNWLQFELAGATVADLFAGTGALGLEAASRGASEVWLVEQHPKAVVSLQEAVEVLGCSGKVHRGDALLWLKAAEEKAFDGVFVDPPFAADLWQATFEALEVTACLKPGAFVYVEAPRDKALDVPVNWRLEKEKASGDVIQRLFRA